MAGIYADLASLMNNPNISISRTPFNPSIVVIKRASFPKGQTPPHLQKYLISKGSCKGVTGKVVYKGKLIPKVAACVAAKRGK